MAWLRTKVSSGGMDVTRHYAKLTDADSQTSPEPVRRAMSAAITSVGLQPPLLDLGTGVGENLRLLSALGPTIGVDVSPSPLRTAKRLSPVTAADAARLPFGDGVFGGSVCTEVLEHVADPAAVLGELARVMRPGGIAVVTTPNYSNPVGLHKLLADARTRRHDYNPWGAHEGGYEAFMTGRKLWRLARPHFTLESVAALDYGQALTGRFRVTDRIANHPVVYRRMEKLVPWLERPGARRRFLPWHGMHVLLVLRRR